MQYPSHRCFILECANAASLIFGSHYPAQSGFRVSQCWLVIIDADLVVIGEGLGLKYGAESIEPGRREICFLLFIFRGKY